MPISLGVSATQQDVEPLSIIRRYAPLCYWRMNESSGTLVNSGSSSSRNATATALTYSQAAIPTRSPSTSVSFNGTTSFAETTAGVIGGASPQFSIGVWIHTTTAAANAALICQRDGTNGGSGFEFKLQNGTNLSFQGVTTSGVNDFSFVSESVAELNDGVPHFVSATVYADTAIIYVDGAQVGNPVGRTGGTWSATPKIFIGQISGGTQRFTGRMSDAFITSQVLTQADHFRIWRNGMLNAVTPSGSNFLDATRIPYPQTTTTLTAYDTDDMTIEPPKEPVTYPGVLTTEAVDSNRSAWFRFAPTTAGRRIRISGTGTPTCYHFLEIYRDTDGTIDGLVYEQSALAYNTSLLQIVAQDTAYYARVRPQRLYPGVLDVKYTYDTPPAAPANDNFANATTLNVTTGGSVAGQLDGSSIEFPLETDNWTSQPNSVWYKFVADATGNITLDTELTSPFNDMALQIWEDTTLAAIEADPYSANWDDNDSGAGGACLVTFPVVSGRTYHIQASDFGTLGNFTLRWSDIT